MLRISAPAKLNLHLEILAREESGYHQLETLFCALELADELDLELTGAAGVELHVEGADTGSPEDNLVHRAARAFLEESGVGGGVKLTLRKRIPVGAGLGGGSSDAAATLLALDRLHREPLGARRRLALGARLGSDVAFFLCGSPLALAWGRGDRLLPLEPLPAADVLLVVPPGAVATAAAYGELAALRRERNLPPTPRVLRLHRLASWEDVASHATNDFEDVVLPRLPELYQARDLLRGEGALLTLLTGSGSVYFGVFPDGSRLQRAAAAIEAALPNVRTIATRTAAPAAPPPFG